MKCVNYKFLNNYYSIYNKFNYEMIDDIVIENSINQIIPPKALVVTAFNEITAEDLLAIYNIECIEVMENYKINNELEDDERNKVHSLFTVEFCHRNY